MNGSLSVPVPSLRGRLIWLMGLRVTTVTILLGWGVLAQIRAPGIWPVNPFFFLIGLTYALTVPYALTLKYVDRHRWLVDLQLAADALTVSAMVFMTGGVTSYFSTLYVLPVVAASVLQFRRGGLLIGVLSVTMHGALVLAQYTGAFGLLDDRWFADPTLPLPAPRVALYTVGLNSFGLIGVATLSGYLAERLRRADARLERASTQIADLQAFNAHVIESLTSGLATTDSEGYVLTYNPAAQAITGHAASSVVGRRIFDLLKLPPDFEAALGETFLGSPRLDFSYATGDGQQIDIGLSAAPLNTPSGRAGFLFAFQDVTESRKIEREARIQQRLAAVGEMAAGIAHEIRNPLASMSGSIQILRESERLNETIKSFLAYARPQRFSTVRLDVRRVINDAALLLRHSAEAGEGHQVDVDVPTDPVWYEADEGQIRQIIWNLATNGLRAMPDGGRLLVAAARAPHGAAAGDVILSVQDQGVGIASEELDGILQPFRGTFAKGSGLGLAIVHRIVSDYGGEIKIASHQDVGTTVTVRLPVGDHGPAATMGSPAVSPERRMSPVRAQSEL